MIVNKYDFLRIVFSYFFNGRGDLILEENKFKIDGFNILDIQYGNKITVYYEDSVDNRYSKIVKWVDDEIESIGNFHLNDGADIGVRHNSRTDEPALIEYKVGVETYIENIRTVKDSNNLIKFSATSNGFYKINSEVVNETDFTLKWMLFGQDKPWKQIKGSSRFTKPFDYNYFKKGFVVGDIKLGMADHDFQKVTYISLDGQRTNTIYYYKNKVSEWNSYFYFN